MAAPVSRRAIIGALLKKELVAYSRDTLYLGLTAVTLIAVVAMFWLLPDTVEESITLAISPPVASIAEEGRDALTALGATEEQLEALDELELGDEEDGLDLIEIENEADLAAAIEGTLEVWRSDDGSIILRDKESGDPKPDDAEKLTVDIGIAFPSSFIADIVTSEDDVRVTVYSDAAVSGDIQNAMKGFVRELAYELAGEELPVSMPDESSIVLGVDRTGAQVSIRDRIIPLLALMMLTIETFSMASLISVEVLQRTVTAVLVTPCRVADFLIAKTIFGTGLAFFQSVLVLALVGAFSSSNWFPLLLTLLIGAFMFTGVAMIVGSAGKDFLGQLFYSMLYIVPLIIPAFSVLFPGSAAVWVQVLPSYPVVDSLVNVAVYGETLADIWPSLAYGVAWLAVLYGAGLFTLKRKVGTL